MSHRDAGRTCANCRWSVPPDAPGLSPRCQSPLNKTEDLSPVIGWTIPAEWKAELCTDQRKRPVSSGDGLCGLQGFWWEPRT